MRRSWRENRRGFTRCAWTCAQPGLGLLRARSSGRRTIPDALEPMREPKGSLCSATKAMPPSSGRPGSSDSEPTSRKGSGNFRVVWLRPGARTAPPGGPGALRWRRRFGALRVSLGRSDGRMTAATQCRARPERPSGSVLRGLRSREGGTVCDHRRRVPAPPSDAGGARAEPGAARASAQPGPEVAGGRAEGIGADQRDAIARPRGQFAAVAWRGLLGR